MKVLQIGPYPPPFGGVQRNLVAIREFLSRRHVQSAVINVTRHRRPDADDVFYPKSAIELVRLLLRLRHDIVHVHFGGMLSPRLLGLFMVCNMLPGRKTVLTFHSGGYPSSPEGRALGPRSLAGMILRRFDRVVAVNGEIMAFLLRIGLDRTRVRMIAPHAFLAGEDAQGELAEPLRTFFGSHGPVLLSVGLLEPEYDLVLQIDVLDRIRKVWPNAGLVLIGSGALEGDLRRAIAARPYAGHVLLCGDMPHNVTMRAIARADVLLRTTLFDGDAISVREALHLGTRVIATDNGMRPAGVTVVPISNLGALETAILEVVSAPRPASAPAGADEGNLEEVFATYRELVPE